MKKLVKPSTSCPFRCFWLPRLRFRGSDSLDVIKVAHKDIERIERNLQKIETLMYTQFSRDEQAYGKFIKLCEEEIEQDLAEVEKVLFELKAISKETKKVHCTEYDALKHAYNNISMRLIQYVEWKCSSHRGWAGDPNGIFSFFFSTIQITDVLRSSCVN